jgi:hypothetical protein
MTEIVGRGIRQIDLTGRGARGADNYQLWLGAGNVGTIDDFLNDMALRADITVVYTAGLSVPSRAALTAVTGAIVGDQVHLTEAGRWGDFEAIATDAAAVASDPGQGIYVAGSGVTWRRIQRNILNVKWFGAVGDDVTNDTTAIQRTLDYACLYMFAADILFPLGRYLVTNLTLPIYNGPQKSIRLIGECMPPFMFGTGTVATMPTWGTVIRSAATTGGFLLKVLSNPDPNSFSNYTLAFERVHFSLYGNPQIGAVDAGKCSQVIYKHLKMSTGIYNMQTPQPTHTDVIAFVTPLAANGALTKGENLEISGFYTGVAIGEHFRDEYINISSCVYATLFEPSNDAISIGRLAVQACPNVIAINGVCAFDVEQLMIENISATQKADPTTSWMTPVSHIKDQGNVAKATVKIRMLDGDIFVPRPLSELIWDGGTGIHVAPVGQSWDSPGNHILSLPISIPNNLAVNLPWASGSGGDSGLQIKVATLTASIAGTTLTVTAATGDALKVGDLITGAGVAAFTIITALGTGTGGTGTYTVNNSQTVASEAMTGGANKMKCVVPGLYELQMGISFAANGSGNRRLIFGVNGGTITGGTDNRPNAGASLETTPTASVTARFAKNDEFTAAAFQDSGVALNLTANAGVLIHKRIAAGFVS